MATTIPRLDHSQISALLEAPAIGPIHKAIFREKLCYRGIAARGAELECFVMLRQIGIEIS